MTLSRSDTAGSLRVQVTDAGAVNQTATFANGQGQATVSIPITSGAPNPGEVDFYLTVTPIDPSTNVVFPIDPLDLRVVASDPTVAPQIVSEFLTTQSIVLSFNKPMNPVGAANLKNYAVSYWNTVNHTYGGTLGGLIMWDSSSVSTSPVRLQSALYDPATQTVTLTFKDLNLETTWVRTLTEVYSKKTPVRPRHPLNLAQALTDMQDNPINADSTPGKVAFRITDPPF